MKLLHFSTRDRTGGAARAAHQLHSALLAEGADSRMMVRYRTTDDPRIVTAPVRPIRSLWSRIRRRYLQATGKKSTYDFNWDLDVPLDPGTLFDANLPCDVLYLHWINEFLNVRTIRRLQAFHRRPIVWVLVDQEPVTGGCHYSFGCDGFKRRCGRCPELDSSDPDDASRVLWERKKEDLSPLPITFVAPSSWVARKIRQSSLFRDHRMERIPLPIDVDVFRPADADAAREDLGIPSGRRVIFFGAGSLKDRRKGMEYLLAALQRLPHLYKGNDVFLLAAGQPNREILEVAPFPGLHLGLIRDDRLLARAYQAADVFVCPSVEDAGPMMIPEAMLCGTVVAAFDAGGAPDLIRPENGFLARYKDGDDLARGIAEILGWPDLPHRRAAALRAAREAHDPAVVARKHLELCRSLTLPSPEVTA